MFNAYRDVKCGNVLLQLADGGQALADGGQALVAKVSDFGTVRINTEQDKAVMRTSQRTHASTGQVCGTGPYMPPEYEKRGQVSPRTDSFAFGECGRFSAHQTFTLQCLDWKVS